MDARFAESEQRTNLRFDRLEASMQELRSEVGDVKISIARLEGPLPRLIVER